MDSKLYDACISGNFDEVQRLFKYEFIKDIFELVCICDHITIAKWIYDQGIHIINPTLFTNVCEYDLLEMAKWLFNKQKNLDISDAFNSAVIYNCVDTFNWLISLDKQKTITDKLIQSVCESGNYKFAKVINERFDVSDWFSENFEFVCISGNMKFIEWVFKFENTNEYKINFYSSTFLPKKKLYVCKWLYQHNMLQFNENDFRNHTTIIKENDSEMIKWLFSLPELFDKKRKAFRSACCAGLLSIANIIYSFGIESDNENNGNVVSDSSDDDSTQNNIVRDYIIDSIFSNCKSENKDEVFKYVYNICKKNRIHISQKTESEIKKLIDNDKQIYINEVLCMFRTKLSRVYYLTRNPLFDEKIFTHEIMKFLFI